MGMVFNGVLGFMLFLGVGIFYYPRIYTAFHSNKGLSVRQTAAIKTAKNKNLNLLNQEDAVSFKPVREVKPALNAANLEALNLSAEEMQELTQTFEKILNRQQF